MKKLAKILALLFAIVIIATGCKKLPEFTDGSSSTPTPVTPVLDEPTVITKAVVSVGITDAVCGGSVEYSGYYELTAVGFCWSEKDEPTIEDHYSVEATSAGSFVGKINNLSPNTTYYVRMYATNANGIYYGEVLSFTTLYEVNGTGTSSDPYNVASGISLQSNGITGWVKGYIVGAVKSGISTVSSNYDINWDAPFELATNVVIADNASCQDISNCIIINLPAGKPLRTNVNLMDNPDNLGKQLAVNGTLRTYYGQAGLRDSAGTESDFILEDAPTPQCVVVFSETFETGAGDFSTQDVVLPSHLTYVWFHASNYSCMQASGYFNTNYESESWLISPYIDLSNVNSANLQFDQAVNYASPQDALSIMVSTNFTGNVTSTSWTMLDLYGWPTGTNFTFVNSSADLTPYIGQYVTLAFKYTSTSSAAATWQVKNIVITGAL